MQKLPRSDPDIGITEGGQKKKRWKKQGYSGLQRILKAFIFRVEKTDTVRSLKLASTMQPARAVKASIIHEAMNIQFPLSPSCSSSLTSDLCPMITRFSCFPFLLHSPFLPPTAGDNGFLSQVINIHSGTLETAGRWR